MNDATDEEISQEDISDEEISEEQASEGKIKILYLGKDNLYWDAIQQYIIKKYPNEFFDFSDLFAEKANEIKTLVPRVIENRPTIIYVDYSQHTEEMLRLAYRIRSEITCRKIPLIGLIDPIDSQLTLAKSFIFGITISHIKTLEVSEVVYHSLLQIIPENIEVPDYALTKNTFFIKAAAFCKIGFLTNQYLHIETDLEFEENSEIDLQTNFINKSEIELSNKFKIVRSDNKNLYYQYKRWYDLEYNHTDDGIIKSIKEKLESAHSNLAADPKNGALQLNISSLDNEMSKARNQVKDDAILRSTTIDEFIEEWQEKSLPKRTKILLIDREMQHIQQAKKHLDSYNFAFRFHSQLDDDLELITSNYAGIIGIEIEYPNGIEKYFFDDEEKERFNQQKDEALQEQHQMKKMIEDVNEKLSHLAESIEPEEKPSDESEKEVEVQLISEKEEKNAKVNEAIQENQKIKKTLMKDLEEADNKIKEVENFIAKISEAEKLAKSDNLNNFNAVSKIIKMIESLEGYNPIIVIFNCRESSSMLKNALNYNRLLIYPDRANFSTLGKMAKSYMEKDGRDSTHDPNLSYHSKEKRVYFDKFSEESTAYYPLNIQVVALSETEIYFRSKISIPANTIFKVEEPITIYFTILPSQKATDLYDEENGIGHYGVIHGLGELEISRLRNFVNKIFFTELDSKKMAEKEEHERKKQEMKNAESPASAGETARE